MLVRIANREDPDQTAFLEAAKTQSDMGLHYISMHLLQATSVPNFRMSTFGIFSSPRYLVLKELLRSKGACVSSWMNGLYASLVPCSRAPMDKG